MQIGEFNQINYPLLSPNNLSIFIKVGLTP